MEFTSNKTKLFVSFFSLDHCIIEHQEVISATSHRTPTQIHPKYVSAMSVGQQVFWEPVSSAVNTWRAAVRAVERLERWSVAHGLSREVWTGVRLSIFLSDAGHSGYSVPTSVRCGLKLMSDSLMLAWPLERPLFMAVCRTSSRSAPAQRSLAEAKKLPCLSVEQLQHLEFVGCSTNVLLAIRWAALMGCLLAHACPPFSDAQRSESIQLGKASLFGFCWRSKRQRTGFPFAALRAGFSKHPWADALRDMLSRFALEHSIVLDYVMPHFGADLARPVPRPAKYACVVGLLRGALRCPPLAVSEATSVQVTMHACRRLLPTLAGQMLMSIESRRVLGHWGPQSAEPQRYDNFRCVSELAYKAQVSANVVAGWQPGADFEPPPSIVANTNTIATTHTVAKTKCYSSDERQATMCAHLDSPRPYQMWMEVWHCFANAKDFFH